MASKTPTSDDFVEGCKRDANTGQLISRIAPFTVKILSVIEVQFSRKLLVNRDPLVAQVENRWHIRNSRVHVFSFVCSLRAIDFEFIHDRGHVIPIIEKIKLLGPKHIDWRYVSIIPNLQGASSDFKHFHQDRSEHALSRILYSLTLNYGSRVITEWPRSIVDYHPQNPLFPAVYKERFLSGFKMKVDRPRRKDKITYTTLSS